MPGSLDSVQRVHWVGTKEEKGSLRQLVALGGIETVNEIGSTYPAEGHEEGCQPGKADVDTYQKIGEKEPVTADPIGQSIETDGPRTASIG